MLLTASLCYLNLSLQFPFMLCICAHAKPDSADSICPLLFGCIFLLYSADWTAGMSKIIYYLAFQCQHVHLFNSIAYYISLAISKE